MELFMDSMNKTLMIFFFGKPVKEENFKSLSVYVKQNQNEF